MNEQERRDGRLQRLLEGAQGLCTLALMAAALVALIGWTMKSPEAPALQDTPRSSAAGNAVLPAPIRALSVSADGQYLDAFQGDSAWRRYDAHTGRELGERRFDTPNAEKIAIRSDNEMMVVLKSAREPEIVNEFGTIWSQPLPEQRPEENLIGCALAADRRLVALISERGSLWLLEFDDEGGVSRRHHAVGCALNEVELSPAGDFAAMVTNEKRVLIWDIAQERVLDRQSSADGTTRIVKWSGDGRKLLTYGYGGKAVVWQPEPLSPLLSWRVDTESVVVGGLSADGRLAAIANTSAIHIRDLQTDREIAVLTGHEGMVSVLLFAEQDRTLFSGDMEGELRRWSLIDNREVWAVH